jgi:hypothetical protein
MVETLLAPKYGKSGNFLISIDLTGNITFFPEYIIFFDKI